MIVSAYTVKAQIERWRNIQNVVLSTPVMDSSKMNPYLNCCGVVRDMELNCLDNEFAQRGDEIWRKQIKIQSEGAKEIEIVFQKFVLSQNAVISFYTDSSEYQYRGAYFVHKPDSSYISNIFNGDYCTIVIEIPMNELDKNQIFISQIHHLTKSFTETVRGGDYSCMIDVNCAEGNDWCNQKRSVAVFYFTEGVWRYQCTGALVNNYQNNFTQYFLTATHCLDEIVNWSTTKFVFNFQNTYCNSNEHEEDDFLYSYYKVQGSQRVGYCDISWSDNALLLITEPIPIQYNVYYAGIDITARSAGDKMTCIHHSMGKPKKIVSGKLQHFAGPKWEIYWDNGIIRGGGSGAPVFLNSNKCVVATVSGGFQNLDCDNNLKQEWVGKLRSCMDYSNNMQNALFGNSGLETIGGIDRNQNCQNNVNLSGDFRSTKEYDATLNGLTIQAGNTITVSNANFYNGSNYTLTAGDRIVLQPGTSIKAGATVSMKIAPCSGSLVSCGTHSSNRKSTENSLQEYEDNDNDSKSDDMLSDNLVTVLPNPNNGTFTINININPQEIKSIQVFNMLGQSIYKQSGLPNTFIQLQSSAKGIYYVEIMTTTQIHTRKIIVQ